VALEVVRELRIAADFKQDEFSHVHATSVRAFHASSSVSGSAPGPSFAEAATSSADSNATVTTTTYIADVFKECFLRIECPVACESLVGDANPPARGSSKDRRPREYPPTSEVARWVRQKSDAATLETT
jgi:hypothetical protein